MYYNVGKSKRQCKRLALLPRAAISDPEGSEFCVKPGLVGR